MLRQYFYMVFGSIASSDVTKVLDIIRDKRRAEIKKEVRLFFPSLFVKKRPAYPLRIPDEFQEATINKEAIEQLIDSYATFRKPQKRDINMDNVSINDEQFAGVMIEIERLVPTGEKTVGGNDRKNVEKITVDASKLTLDNFTELTGRRFRMSNGQVSRLGTGLEARRTAFNEFLSEAVTYARNTR
jgi:hypothetical protein